MFKGCCTALVTPFDKDNRVNFKALEKIIEDQIKRGVSALLLLGTTGESPTLSFGEKISVVKFAVDVVRHRVPVIAGAGSNDTMKVIEFGNAYKNLGADAILVVAPYYNKATQEGLFLHYKTIAENVNCPIYIYNVPSRTGINVSADTIVKLSSISNIYGVKQASGDMNELMDIKSGCRENFSIYSGEDALSYLMLTVGAKGTISVASNLFPQYVQSLCDNFFEGKHEKSLEMQLKLNPLVKELFSEVNPIPVKHGMNYIGYDVGKPRLPLTEMKDTKKLEEEIERLK